ncbi:arginine deiminase [Thermoplasmatales archaeon AK]|nr:arginine deiminase [Thermoplasmatales archaeon AK]
MRIRSEWDTLREVMIHRPGIEIDYAMLAPKPFLFERPFNTERARQEHIVLEERLKENGVRVRLLRESIIKRADRDSNFRKLLEEKVLNQVKFFGELTHTSKAMEEFRRNISLLDASTLVNTLILEPSIDLRMEVENKLEYPRIYSNVPLANLYFMRDQQAVGPNGIVIGNMKRSQRIRETEITEFVMRNIVGETNITKVSPTSNLEGGDFMPSGSFAIIGKGARTNDTGTRELMSSAAMDFDEYCVVSNPRYQFLEENFDPMINMHLDTYFNIAGNGLAVGSVELMKNAKAEIYSDGSERPLTVTNLYSYITEKGFSIIDLSVAEQLSYASNFLTISDRKIISVNTPRVLRLLLNQHVFPKKLEDVVIKQMNTKGEGRLFPSESVCSEFGIDNTELDLRELTGGYGGAHCMTAALVRS